MAKNKKGRNINGILLLDKEQGITSNRALQQIKKLYDAKKAGHTGSLDPIATGILPICLGEATKFASYLLNDDKAYFVVATLGQTTTTLDSEGSITSKRSINNITPAKIQKVIKQFIGKIQQVPPMHSALKKNGVPLYKLARKGIEIERKAREIEIYNAQFLGYQNGELSINVSCSKGTYIRTLVDDIGAQLGCGAFVSQLRRIKFAHLDLSQSFKWCDLENLTQQELDAKLIKSENILPDMPSIQLTKQQATHISFDRKITLEPQAQKSQNGLVKMFDNDTFLGIGEAENNNLTVKRLFNL